MKDIIINYNNSIWISLVVNDLEDGWVFLEVLETFVQGLYSGVDSSSFLFDFFGLAEGFEDGFLVEFVEEDHLEGVLALTD